MPEQDQNTPPTEQTIVSGGPGGDANAAFGKEITIGDVKYRVTEDVAKAIEAQQAAFNDQAGKSQGQIDELGQRITEISNRPAPAAAAAPATVEATPTYGQTFFDDPDGTLQRFGESLKAEWNKDLNQARSDYQSAENLKDFWTDFYGANEALKADDFLVKAMFTGRWNELGHLTRPEAIKKLASMVEERIVDYKGHKPKPTAPATTPTEVIVEGGGQAQVPKPSGQGEQPVLSLSSAIKDRQEKRRSTGTA